MQSRFVSLTCSNIVLLSAIHIAPVFGAWILCETFVLLGSLCSIILFLIYNNVSNLSCLELRSWILYVSSQMMVLNQLECSQTLGKLLCNIAMNVWSILPNECDYAVSEWRLCLCISNIVYFFFFEDDPVQEMNDRREIEDRFPSIDLCGQEDTSTSKQLVITTSSLSELETFYGESDLMGYSLTSIRENFSVISFVITSLRALLAVPFSC